MGRTSSSLVHQMPSNVSAQHSPANLLALPLAEELGMCPLQAHCHRSLGTLYAKTGQRERSRAELSTAIAM
jgi:hypothetical protein